MQSIKELSSNGIQIQFYQRVLKLHKFSLKSVFFSIKKWNMLLFSGAHDIFILLQLSKGTRTRSSIFDLNFPNIIFFIQFIMGRQPKKCPKKCPNHHFLLKPVHYSAFLSRDTSFLYCPQSLKGQQNIPKFNRDGRSYTSSFILAIDQIRLQANNDAYKLQHERLKNQMQEQKSQIFVARPKLKYNYCNVCKKNYEDYLNHIHSSEHKKAIQVNPFNKEILQLCKDVQMKNQAFNQAQNRQMWNCSMQSTQFSQIFNESQAQKDRRFFGFSDQFDLFKEQLKPLDYLPSTKSMKSFQSCKDNLQNAIQNNDNPLPSFIFKQGNENQLNQNFGYFNFKQVSCTASPTKPKFQRPIIISSSRLNFDS